jgi:hypothetical protein
VCLSFNNSNLLQIGIPPTLGQVVRVAHPMSVNRTFVTDFASLRHDEKLSVSFAYWLRPSLGLRAVALALRVGLAFALLTCAGSPYAEKSDSGV